MSPSKSSCSGVSELISSTLLILITLALGTIIITSISNYSYNVNTLFRSDIERRSVDLMKSLDLIMVSGSKSANKIKLVISNGVVELKVMAIYVDDVPVGGLDLVLAPLDIKVVEFEPPIKLFEDSMFRVKVVYEGGEKVSYGYVYE